MTIKNKRILVTGGAGFIGSFCSKALLIEGCNVHAIDNLNSYYDIDLKKTRLKELETFNNFYFSNFDLIDSVKLHQTFLSFKPDIVIHLAAQAGVRYSLKQPIAYLDSNIISFFNLIEAMKDFKVDKFIFASSSSVYGNSSALPYSEDAPTNRPVSLYAATKKTNEILAHAFSFNTGTPTIGLRFFTVYGPKGRPDMAYFKFAKLISSNEEITVFNKGKMSRDMTYIDDVVQGITASVKFDKFTNTIPYELFNLGNNSPISTWDLIYCIEDFFGFKGNYIFEQSDTEVERTWADIKKPRKMLGYHPKTKFEDGMNYFLNWFIDYKEELKK